MGKRADHWQMWPKWQGEILDGYEVTLKALPLDVLKKVVSAFGERIDEEDLERCPDAYIASVLVSKMLDSGSAFLDIEDFMEDRFSSIVEKG